MAALPEYAADPRGPRRKEGPLEREANTLSDRRTVSPAGKPLQAVCTYFRQRAGSLSNILEGGWGNVARLDYLQEKTEEITWLRRVKFIA